ncbi:TIGR02221 family CRISPR-associated protein [Salinarimonas chemoclinalis]|uniref:TIGR02221 family CRISPR-associated protein n=1 Tax=Salinarimonas chemoclinalis TaxID=3241599 RepID=UPI0035572BCA
MTAPRILLTFLGAGQYTPTTYRFASGAERETAFFGTALVEELRAEGMAPDRVVLAGTSGSGWGVALRALDGESDLQARLHAEAEANAKAYGNAFDEALLEEARERFTAAYGTTVEPVVLPYGRTEAEALSLLPLLHDRVPPYARLVLDVTNGLRHLPMTALAAALALETLAPAPIDGVYYGAQSMKTETGAAPVLRLDGLIQLMRWVRALAVYDATGRIGPLARAVEGGAATRGDADLAASLDHADFLEQAGRLDEAVPALDALVSALASAQGPVAPLVAPALSARLAWRANATHSARQAALARTALAAGDYLRAALHGFEAEVSRRMEAEGKDPRDRKARTRAQELHGKDAVAIVEKNAPASERERAAAATHLDLKNLRNALAHGTEPRGEALKAALADKGALVALLERLLPVS